VCLYNADHDADHNANHNADHVPQTHPTQNHIQSGTYTVVKIFNENHDDLNKMIRTGAMRPTNVETHGRVSLQQQRLSPLMYTEMGIIVSSKFAK